MTTVSAPSAETASAGVTVGEQLELATEVLADAGVATPGVDARWLLQHVLEGDPRREPDRRLTHDQVAALLALVERRAARTPLQLVLGESAFRTLTLACAPGVFVPRPETEIVAGLAIDAALAAGPRPVIAEPCTGTGAIACSLAAEVPGARVVAGDIDTRAVGLARRNADRLGRGVAGPAGVAPGATVEVRQGALLEAVPPGLRGRLDVLVANPPYLPAAERPTWSPEVADHDPDAALVGGADGHEVVDALLIEAARWLAPGGTVVLEIDERRGDDVREAAMRAGLRDVRLRADLTGAWRAVVARRGDRTTGATT
jgi:release factor glutamine methyltransferase